MVVTRVGVGEAATWMMSGLNPGLQHTGRWVVGHARVVVERVLLLAVFPAVVARQRATLFEFGSAVGIGFEWGPADVGKELLLGIESGGELFGDARFGAVEEVHGSGPLSEVSGSAVSGWPRGFIYLMRHMHHDGHAGVFVLGVFCGFQAKRVGKTRGFLQVQKTT